MRPPFYFDDPDDLGITCSAGITILFQLEILDFARRYYKRKGDVASKRKSDEIKKMMRTVGDMTTQGVWAFVTDKITLEYWKYNNKKNIF